jgi:integrase
MRALMMVRRFAASRDSMRERTGTVTYDEAKGCYCIKLTLNCGTRTPWLPLSPAVRSPNAEMRAREVAAERSKIARDEDLKPEDFGMKPRAPKTAPGGGSGPAIRGEATMEGWLGVWLTSRRAKGQTSTRENESHYGHHIKEATGGRHVRDWTTDDLRALSRSLDAKVQGNEMKWKTAWNVWATASRICRDACSSKLDELRVRSDNPARDVAGPDRGAATAKQYLYPSEFERLLACSKVPLQWRRLVALSIYLYPRAGELRVLRWQDVDLEHGVIHIHLARDRETGLAKATKTKHARRFGIEPALVPLLKAMRGEKTGEALVMTLPSERVMARALRRWLKRAGVNREELHADAPTRKKLTFHDLRATGLTWLAIRGDDPLRIQQRAGHEDFTTTQGYIREAESIRDGFGEVFPALPESLFGDDSEGSESYRESSAELLRELTTRNLSGVDGTRTRGLRRDRPAL